ncbi:MULTISPECIES: lysozyme inhibitor LprI family protein [Novosphingobium]|uniref:lysozyme inhibitor LprI family protein n=1 Tax=Novosphingobium TaxID=165696 RepID=UPI0022F280B8|nr:lysozyme inhibitor LprI family protein [Novosphingobium resinovorum]
MRFCTQAIALCCAISGTMPAAAADREEDSTAIALSHCLDEPANSSTAGQTGCVTTAERRYDARMNAAYRILMGRLPAASASRLRESQRAWLLFRDAERKAQAELFGQRRGTMFVPMEADASATMIGDRARLLERYARILEIDP